MSAARPPLLDESDPAVTSGSAAAASYAAARRPGARGASLLPPPRLAGPVPWVIAILIALVVIAAAGGLALSNLAAGARSELSAAVTVQVIEPNPELRPKASETAAQLLAAQPLVRSVRVVPEAELAALIEPWLGPGAASGDVPIPGLIDVELVRAAEPGDIKRLAAALAEAVPAARVDAQSAWLGPVYDALAALQWLALGLIVLLALATGAAVWIAARSAFADQRETVEILHLLGSTDQQITRIFLASVLREAAFGALLGAAIGGLAVWALGQQFAGLDSALARGGGLAFSDWTLLAAIPLGGVLLALGTARITIALALKAML